MSARALKPVLKAKAASLAAAALLTVASIPAPLPDGSLRIVLRGQEPEDTGRPMP